MSKPAKAPSAHAADARAVAHAKTLGGVLAYRRRSEGLTQAEVAKRMGVHVVVVSKIERGSDVQLSSVIRYVRAIGEQGFLFFVTAEEAPGLDGYGAFRLDYEPMKEE